MGTDGSKVKNGAYIWSHLHKFFTNRKNYPCFYCKKRVSYIWPLIYDFDVKKCEREEKFPRRHFRVTESPKTSRFESKVVTACSLDCLEKMKVTEAKSDIENLEPVLNEKLNDMNIQKEKNGRKGKAEQKEKYSDANEESRKENKRNKDKSKNEENVEEKQCKKCLKIKGDVKLKSCVGCL